MLRSGIAGSYGSFIFHFLRHFHTVFHSGCSNLHSHQECTWVPLSPHSHQICYFFFLIIAILINMKWYSIVVLNCISLMISDAEHLFMYLWVIASVHWKNIYSVCKTQNSGLSSKEEKPRDPINEPSRCNAQEGLLSAAQPGDSDLLGGRAHRTANWASFL